MKKRKKLTYYAECLCKGIKVKIQDKIRHVSNCHCIQCMKTHGNFAAYTSCEEQNMSFINKSTLRWFKSSKIAKRGFCVKCGASFFYKKYKSKNISIAAGMLKSPTKLKTYANIYVKNKMDYYKLDPKIPKFAKLK